MDRAFQSSYKRKVVYTAPSVNPLATDQFFSFPFILANMSASKLTALQSLFDYYKVIEVTVSWVPAVTMAYLGPSDSALPQLWSVTDFDDGNVPASASELESYSSVLKSNAGKPMSRRFRPAILVTGESATHYVSSNEQWIDVANATAGHYGTKWYISGIPTPPTTNLGHFTITAEIMLRGSR